MSDYMKGFSKRKPYGADRLSRGNRLGFFSYPVRHLLESLERESALEKPYLEFNSPRRRHLLPGGGQVKRFGATSSSYNITDRLRVEYNAPECVVDIRNLDCDQEPGGHITIDYRSGWQVGQGIVFVAGCDQPGVIEFDPAVYDRYWSVGTLNGRWITKPTGPLKLTCSGSVYYSGQWAASEVKTGITTITQLTQSVSTGGTIATSSGLAGTNTIGKSMNSRGDNIHVLREYSLDPDLASLTGLNIITASARTAAAALVTQGISFNNVISSNSLKDLSYGERQQRLDWFGTPGRITSWYSGTLSCPAIEVDVSCDDVNCDDVAPMGFSSTSDGAIEVTAGGAGVTVGFHGGTPPFYWTVSPGEFSLASSITTTRTNTLTASGSACGMAIITVTDACGNSISWAVRETGGVNTNWSTEETCGVEDDQAYVATGVSAEGYFALDNWCGWTPRTSCAVNCAGNCPALIAGSVYAVRPPPSDVSPCWVEYTEKLSWTCN